MKTSYFSAISIRGDECEKKSHSATLLITVDREVLAGLVKQDAPPGS